MSSALFAKQEQLVARFLVIEDAQERLAAIVARGRKWPPVEPAERTDAQRVTGCLSQVWLSGRVEEGRCHFRMSADSPLVQGLAALLCELHEGLTSAAICEAEPDLLHKLGLAELLSPTRLNGLANIRGAIRAFAGSQM